MSKELKPCPFCGKKVKVEYYEIDTPVTFTECGYEICCYFCGVRFKERLSRMPQFDEKAEMKRQMLIERWNRRVSDDIGSNEADRPQGKWITKVVKRLCASDCWYPGIFAIEGSWNEREGSWLEEQDGFCSECEKQDEHYYGHKYCPNCGARMKGADNE